MPPFHVLVAYALFTFAALLGYVVLSGMIWGSGWAPSSRRQLEAAATLLGLREGETVYDLGSGFGRALIFFAEKYRVSAVGVEVDPLRGLVTAWSARRHGLPGVRVLRGNLLDADLRGASKVFVFLTPLIMRRLQGKLSKDMRPGSLVVSVDHRFPDWETVRSIDNVHLYVLGQSPKVMGAQHRTS
ncbi:MAG: hypothetical protein JRN23_06775 [Nitrososphaerota archaeon]|nr:hypothetical protein [Nitrososphaerota archaeon]MDG6978303.1 hypothetical protein [Nitrososphaerota archaeon]MDG7021618.1 hypothetical protein [Nitrososphaerota archaeon]